MNKENVAEIKISVLFNLENLAGYCVDLVIIIELVGMEFNTVLRNTVVKVKLYSNLLRICFLYACVLKSDCFGLCLCDVLLIGSRNIFPTIWKR